MPRETGVGFGWNCLNWKPNLNEDPSLEDSPLPIPLFSKVGEVLFRKTDWDPMSCCGWQLDDFDDRDLQMWYRSLRLIIVTKILAVFEDFLGKKNFILTCGLLTWLNNSLHKSPSFFGVWGSATLGFRLSESWEITRLRVVYPTFGVEKWAKESNPNVNTPAVWIHKNDKIDNIHFSYLTIQFIYIYIWVCVCEKSCWPKNLQPSCQTSVFCAAVQILWWRFHW